MDATEVLNRLTELGITARTAGEKLLLEPGSKVPPELLSEVRQNKSDLVALLTSTWPPSDAEELIAAWEVHGRPEIPLSPGISVSNLRTWFHPVLPFEHMAEHMEAVRGFIYEGLPL